MYRHFTWAMLVAGGCLLGGCESLPEGALGELGRGVLGDVVNTAAATASVQMIRETAESMCSPDNQMCNNLTTVAMTGFTKGFIEQLTKSDVRRINEAREESIETGEDQTWENPESGASGRVSTEPAPPRPPQPTPVKVKKDRLTSLPMMDAVGQPYVISAAGGANVRGGPSTDYEVVERLASEERVQAIGKVRGSDWYLVGRGSVGIGYVFAELMERWKAPEKATLDEASEPTKPEPPAEDVAEVEVEMASECFTTTQTVTLGDGTTEDAKVTSCRTPDGWVTV